MRKRCARPPGCWRNRSRLFLGRAKAFEDAFARIRAYYEGKGNQTGLDILDSYEEQWAVSESLSDRQLEWLEKQLSWSRRGGGSNRGPDATVTADPVPKDEAELLDAMIVSRLAAQGKTPVDADRIDRLRQAVSDLNDALAGPGA